MTYGQSAAARFLFLAAWGLAAVVASPAVAEEETGSATPRRGRIAAMLTALFYHQFDPNLAEFQTDPARFPVFASLSPDQYGDRRAKNSVVAFAKTLVYEGGYFPEKICALMGYDNRTTARIARKVRQLDTAMGRRSSPWEVAGRIGRSGSVDGADDLMAMNGGTTNGGSGNGSLKTSGTLAWLPVLAVAYAEYPKDGLNAAAQLSALKDDDPRSEPVARAAFSLLRQALVASRQDRDEWLRRAAADSGESETENEIRAVRVKDWRYLRGEECAMGRLERVVYLWYRGDSYERTMEEGVKFLAARECLDALAALAGVTYGRDGLPYEIVSEAARDRDLLEIVNDLYDLATSEAVLRVSPEDEEF